MLDKNNKDKINKEFLSPEEQEKMILKHMDLPKQILFGKKDIKINLSLLSKETIEDIIGEGYRGLITGVKKFDPSLGHKPATYIKWWVYQAMMEFIYERSLVHTPRNKLLSKNKQEIKIVYLDANIFDNNTLDNYNAIVVAQEKNNNSTNNKIASKESSSAEKNIALIENKNFIDHLCKSSNLNEQEVLVLEHYYGLNNNISKTFREIVPIFEVEFGSISAAQIKNLRDNAIKKMKKNDEVKQIKEKR